MVRRYLSVAVALAITSVAFAGALDEVRDQFQRDYLGARLFIDGAQLRAVYGTPVSVGASAIESADAFVRTHANLFGVSIDELAPGNTFNHQFTQPVMYDQATGEYKFTLVYYHQHKDGVPVHEADLRLLVRNDAEEFFPLVLVGSSLRPLGNFGVDDGVLANFAEDAAHQAALAVAPGLASFSPAEPVIWAGVNNELPEPRLAISFVADNAQPATTTYEKYRFFCDAATGEVLHQENMILNVDIEGSVSALASPDHRADACITEEMIDMPYARVSIGSNHYFADVNGDFVIPNSGSTPVNLNSLIRGKYFVVYNQAGSNSQITLQVTPPGPANFEHNPSNSEYTTSEVNAYIQANYVRDMVLAANPQYPTIANQTEFPVNVNLNDTCNAFYDYQSINFFRAGGGCNNTGFGDVVHHEFGHHVVATGGSGQGEYGEGMGDVCGVLVTGRSQLGIGFRNCASGIRNADNTCQFLPQGCSTCGSAIHSCGQLLSGCVWDTRKELMITEPVEYHEIIRDLAINAVLVHSGTSIRDDIVIAYLTLDDDDNNINNGTPHYAEIAAGFGKHDIDAPALQLLEFTYPNGRPDMISPKGGATILVELTAIVSQPQAGTGMFHYDAGSGWVEVAMTEVSPNVYDAVFPAIACGSGVPYYFTAKTTDNQEVRDPDEGSFSTLSGYGLVLEFEDAFESNKGWTVFNGATLGNWERADPQRVTNSGETTQPEDDHSPNGQLCFVTGPLAGSGAGSYDVDNGPTQLTSPVFELAGKNAVVSYWRWYYIGTQLDDEFLVEVSNNNGAAWTVVERIVDTRQWTFAKWQISDYVTPTDQVLVRFTADDSPNNSLVEALVDDFMIETVDCEPPYAKGDLNCDGKLDFGDINPFVLALSDPNGYASQFPDCDRMLADINDDGKVDFGDINPFVDLLTAP